MMLDNIKQYLTNLFKDIEQLRKICFYIGYTLIFLGFWLTKTQFKVNEEMLTIISIIPLAVSINYRKYKLKDIAILGMLFILGVLVYYFSKDWSVIKIVLILATIKERNIRKIIKCSFYVCFILTFMTIISSLIFDIGKVYIIKDFGRDDLETRFCFGFNHPNQFHNTITYLIITYMYIKNDKLKINNIAILSVINIIAYIFSASRTGLLITFVAIIVNTIFYNMRTTKDNVLSKLIQCIYIGIIAFQVIIVMLYGEIDFLDKLNDILNNRIMVAHRYYANYGISAFGSIVKEGAFELGYVNSLIKLGVIPVTLLIIAQMVLIKRYMINKEYKKVALIMVLTLYSFAENNWFFVFRNLSILLCADLIYGKDIKPIKEI